MRTLIKVTIDVAKGNEAIRSGRLARLIQEQMHEYRPEAAYFYSDNGQRAALFVVDLEDASQIPAIAEPWFLELDARVEFQPVMNVEDVKKGLERWQAAELTAR